MVAQTVDGTTITVEYSRPVARGREVLFGGVVHWGETWTPGADWATTLEVDKPIRINGEPLPRGKYSVWMIPQPDEWTVILHREARRFHTRIPGKEGEQLRFRVKPEQGPYLETLTWYFPAVARDGTSLRMQWGTTYVPLRITVEPSRPLSISRDERAVYRASYRTGGGTLEVVEAENLLRVRARPAVAGLPAEFELVPDSRVASWRGRRQEEDRGTGRSTGHRYHPAVYSAGRLLDVHPELTVVFRAEAGQATGLEIRSVEGQVVARAERVR